MADLVLAPAFMARGDKVYNGDRTKWLKFAYGLRAINLSHYSNHTSYNPAAIIAAVDSSFASNADDALLLYPGTVNDDRNFMGRTRGNFVDYRQTQFVVGLLDGTHFGARDPRLTRMLSPSPDGLYRGLDPDVVGYGALTTTQRPNNPYGYPLSGGLQLPGLYLFDDKARYPAMTYAQLQFIKAEAAYRTDKPLALTAYRTAISAHIDFVNARNAEAGLASQITATEKAAFLADPLVVPTAANLTLTHIMSQKYIAQWAWAFNETWMDLRRYDYVDLDPSGARQVFPGFDIPTTLYPDNGGQPVYRLRPRYFSEYVWSIPALTVIGGMQPNYHTKKPWIIDPASNP